MSIAPPPHRRHLPDVPINERGMRQLEIWLRDMMRTLIARGANFDGYIRFNRDNQGPNEGTGKRGYLDITANGTDPNGFGIYLNDDTGVDGMMLEAEVSVTLRNQDDQAKIIVHDDAGGLAFYSNDHGMWFDDQLKASRGTNPSNGIWFTTGNDIVGTSGSTILWNLFPATGENWRISQTIHDYVIEGDDTSDSYVDETHYLNGGTFEVNAGASNGNGKSGNSGEVRLNTAGEGFGGEGDGGDIVLDARADTVTNVPGTIDVDGGVLDVLTTADDAGVGIRLHDTGASGGVDIQSDNGNVAVSASAGQVNLGTPGASFSLGATDSSMQILNLGDTFKIFDSGGSALVTYTG